MIESLTDTQQQMARAAATIRSLRSELAFEEIKARQLLEEVDYETHGGTLDNGVQVMVWRDCFCEDYRFIPKGTLGKITGINMGIHFVNINDQIYRLSCENLEETNDE